MEAKFNLWIETEVIKRNSSLISQEAYDTIVSYLLGNKNNVERKVQKRVDRKGMRLLDYPTLGLKNVLCVPSCEKVK